MVQNLHDEVLGADVRPVYKLEMTYYHDQWIEHVILKDGKVWEQITDFIPHPCAVVLPDLTAVFYQHEHEARAAAKKLDGTYVEVSD
jgi:hypothetical protein